MNAKDVAVEGDITTTRFFARAFCEAGGITRETVNDMWYHGDVFLFASRGIVARDRAARFLADLLDIGEVE